MTLKIGVMEFSFATKGINYINKLHFKIYSKEKLILIENGYFKLQ